MPIRGIPCDNFTASKEACEKNPRPIPQDMSLSELADQIYEASKFNRDLAMKAFGTLFGATDIPPENERCIDCLHSHLYAILDEIKRTNDILYKLNTSM